MSVVATKPAASKQNKRRDVGTKPILRSQKAPRINSRVLLDSNSFSGLG